MSKSVRLHKAIAQAGITSRRKAEELISLGEVKVNGKLVKTQGVLIDPANDIIEVSGKEVTTRKIKKHYFLLNKPVGFVTTKADPYHEKTVMDLVPDVKGLFPVGRLDKNTTGILLITNDGDLTHRLTHPSFEIDKIYNAKIKGSVSTVDLEKLEKGILIDGDRTAPCKIKRLKVGKNNTVVQVIIHEGKKRQIRRMFTQIGHDVIELNRAEYAGLKALVKRGSYRKLTDFEIKNLRKKAGLV